MCVSTGHEAKGRIAAERIAELAEAGPLLVLTNETHLRDHTDTLLGVEWRRVVLDESQRINNRKHDFGAACSLRAEHKWSLSGTPVENRIDDFGPHLELIGASKLTAEMMSDPEKLAGVCLRRTKLGVEHNYQERLPKCYVRVDPEQSGVSFTMDPAEMDAFQAKFSGSKNLLGCVAKQDIGSIVAGYQ